MIQLKKIFSDCEFGELKNSVIKDIAVIGVIDNIVYSLSKTTTNKSTKSPSRQTPSGHSHFDTDMTNICYKIDSGAEANVMPENMIKTLQAKSKITKSTTTLSAYNGRNITVK